MMMMSTLAKGWRKAGRIPRTAGAALAALALLLTAACSGGEGPAAGGTTAGKGDVTLVIGAYSVAKDAVSALLPKFQAEWKAKTGQTVVFQQSYEASGTQARAIAGGFEADVTLLAMEG